jgi:flagellar basal-body rod protein FlgC
LSDIKNIFDIAARGMSAQMVRLNTVASNLANARSVASSDAEAYKAYQPGHPKADKDGFIYTAAVNVDEELVEMLEASRQYENNVEMVTTLRGLMMRTISMGK